MVRGICFKGSRIQDGDVDLMNGICEPVPAAQALGIPLVVRRDTGMEVDSNMHFCVRFMTDPNVGLAPMGWQCGGCEPRAPVVLCGRTDGVPFTTAGWAMLDDFICEACNEGPAGEFTRNKFLRRFGKRARDLPDVSLSLAMHFPQYSRVTAVNLKKATHLNGITGVVDGRYQNGRVGVRFPEPHGLKAVKPDKLVLEKDAKK